jgi:ferredoxin-fold anticodon binding domain-containing protein
MAKDDYILLSAKDAAHKTALERQRIKENKILRARMFVKDTVTPAINKAIKEGLYSVSMSTDDDLDPKIVQDLLIELGYKVQYLFDRRSSDDDTYMGTSSRYSHKFGICWS